MSRSDFYNRCLSIYIILTGLVTAQSILLNTYQSLGFFVGYALLLNYRSYFGKKNFQIKFFSIFICLILVFFRISEPFESKSLIFYLFVLLMTIVPIFILRADTERGFWLLFLILGIQNVISVVLSRSDIVILFFILGIFSCIFTLYSSYIYFSPVKLSIRYEPLMSGSFSRFFLAIPSGILTGLLIFILFPRLHGFSAGLGWGPSFRRVGYSGAVSLSNSGRLGSSNQLIMYVQSKDSDWFQVESQNLLLRGISLDRFNGESWEKNQDISENGINSVNNRSDFRGSRIVTIQRINSLSSSLFYPGKYVGLWFLNHGFSESFNKSTGDLNLLNNYDGRLSYSLLFEQNRELDNADKTKIVDFRDVSLEKQLGYWLEIPQEFRREGWFQDFVRQMMIREDEQLVRVLSKITGFFARNFEVSLDSSHSNGTEKLRHFLIEAKKGHCEYFATAAILTLRALGVPARMVIGYKGGVYNGLIDTLEVRSSDAHAWVELWHPKWGWISYDPTPSTLSEDSISSYLLLYFNAADYIFKRYIAGYDGQTQRDLIDLFKSSFLNGNYSRKNMDLILDKWVPSIIAILSLGIIILMSAKFLKRKRGEIVVPLFYAPIYAYIKKSGFKKAEAETFRSFHNRLKKLGFNYVELDQLTELIEEYLYSNGQERDITKKGRIIGGRLLSRHKNRDVN